MSEAVKVFSLHSIQIEGVNTRVAQVTCGHCSSTATMRNNTQAQGFDVDSIVERRIAAKFEKLGWKIAKSPVGHRCPACFNAIKLAAVRKRESTMEKEKVVAIAAPPRSPSRDEKRIILAELQQNYLDEKRGYAADWSDKRIAEDLNVPAAWVANLREENFGPNTSEAVTKAETEIAAFMVELTTLKEAVEMATGMLAELDKKAERLTKGLAKLRL